MSVSVLVKLSTKKRRTTILRFTGICINTDDYMQNELLGETAK